MLNLQNNQIDDQGIQHLTHTLKNNTVKSNSLLIYFAYYYVQTLKILDLADNRICSQGARYLANLLQNNKVRSISFLFISFSF